MISRPPTPILLFPTSPHRLARRASGWTNDSRRYGDKEAWIDAADKFGIAGNGCSMGISCNAAASNLRILAEQATLRLKQKI
jgi:hypothetical protein